jgi:hypothetical protein
MRSIALSIPLVLASLPAIAGGFTFELPTLTWPTTATVSTQNCEPAQSPCK